MNEKLKTMNIKGKEYVTVNERLKAFRTQAEFAGWTLQTVPHELTNDVAVFEARILDKDGRLRANGFAREVRTQAGSMVNATSHIENCETSAWGRALGNLGIGIDESICSAQELLVAVGMQQSKPAVAEPQPAAPKMPSSSVTPQPQEKPAERPQLANKPLTPREQDELDDALAKMDFAQNRAELLDIFEMYKDANFAHILQEHGAKICSQKGWRVA
jgi:hypothetical protein